MSMREHSDRYGPWARGAEGEREPWSPPADCDCGDTVRELLVESAATAAAFFAIILVVRALL